MEGALGGRTLPCAEGEGLSELLWHSKAKQHERVSFGQFHLLFTSHPISGDYSLND